MKNVKIHILSTWEHCSQIVTRFRMLESGDCKVSIESTRNMKIENPNNITVILVEYKGKKMCMI